MFSKSDALFRLVLFLFGVVSMLVSVFASSTGVFLFGLGILSSWVLICIFDEARFDFQPDFQDDSGTTYRVVCGDGEIASWVMARFGFR